MAVAGGWVGAGGGAPVRVELGEVAPVRVAGAGVEPEALQVRGVPGPRAAEIGQRRQATGLAASSRSWCRRV